MQWIEKWQIRSKESNESKNNKLEIKKVINKKTTNQKEVQN